MALKGKKKSAYQRKLMAVRRAKAKELLDGPDKRIWQSYFDGGRKEAYADSFRAWEPVAEVYPWVRPWRNKGQRDLMAYLGLTVEDMVHGVRLLHSSTGEYRDLGGIMDRVALLEERVVSLSYALAEMQADNVMMMGTEAEEMDSARAIVERDEEALG